MKTYSKNVSHTCLCTHTHTLTELAIYIYRVPHNDTMTILFVRM